jgi:hypothetical protein
MYTKSGGIDFNFSVMVSGWSDSTGEVSDSVTATDDEFCCVFLWPILLQLITDFHVCGREPGVWSSNQNLELI